MSSIPLDTENSVNASVVICAIGESCYMIDAIRFVEVFLARGIPESTIVVYGTPTRNSAIADLKDAAPKLPFTLDHKKFKTLYDKHYRGSASNFFNALQTLAISEDCKAVTVILINHGNSDGCFGCSSTSFTPNEVYDVIVQINKPLAIICSACYTESIFYLLDRSVKSTQIVKIYDEGPANGVTYNWGVEVTKERPLIDMGSLLAHQLFEVFYEAQNNYELASMLISMNGKMKPSESDPDCCIKVNTPDLTLLWKYSFFGSHAPNPPLTQSPLYVKTTSSPQVKGVHSQFTKELHEKVQLYLERIKSSAPVIYQNFWTEVYANPIYHLALRSDACYREALEVTKVLKANNLINTEFNGAGLTFVLAVHGLAKDFINFITEKSGHDPYL